MGAGTVAVMSSNLGCIGLAVADHDELARLAAAVLPDAVFIGRGGRVDVLRWEDPSGARLILGLREQEIIDLLPSFAGRPGARLANIRPSGREVVFADVIDEDGEQCTAMATELEQRRQLPDTSGLGDGLTSVVALGTDVSVHADADAFAASDASLLGSPDEAREPPAHFVERGWRWPPRVAAESFFSYGVFASKGEPQAYARLAGTVVHAERRTVRQTGQGFTVARVRTTGFEVDLCMAATEHPHPPAPGSIIAGTVFLVASLGSATAGQHRK